METRFLQLDRLEFRDDGTPGFTARIVPFGEIATIRGGVQERFTATTVFDRAGTVPLSIDHGNGALEQIGRMADFEVRDDGAYADFTISDTAAGRDTHTLLRDGVLESVSIGFIPGESTTDDEGVTVRESVTLDHVAVVRRGAYTTAGAVSVRAEEAPVAENETADEAVKERADTPAVDVDKIEDRMRGIEALVQGIADGNVTAEPRYPDMGTFMRNWVLAQHGDDQALKQEAELQLRALAQDTTTTSTGIVPNYYASEVISVVDNARPLVASLDRDPIGDYGMNVVYPKVVTKPTVAVQSSEGAEVSSTALDIDPVTVALSTFAGANAASIQLIERSNPAFVAAFYREMGHAYAAATSAKAVDLIQAETTGTSVLADFGADAAATVAALVAAAVGIATNVRRMPSHMAVSPARWGQLMELVDSTGRPLFPWSGNGPVNALGQSALSQASAQLSGLEVIMDANLTTNEAFMYWSGAASVLEQAPIQLRATRVSTLEVELGVYGYMGVAVKYPLGIHEFTAA